MKMQHDTGLLLPLSERPTQAEVSLQDLFTWHSTAEAQAKAVGAAFVEEDDGPSAEDLLVRAPSPQPDVTCITSNAQKWCANLRMSDSSAHVSTYHQQMPGWSSGTLTCQRRKHKRKNLRRPPCELLCYLLCHQMSTTLAVRLEQQNAAMSCCLCQIFSSAPVECCTRSSKPTCTTTTTHTAS